MSDKPLVDDLAYVLTSMVVGWQPIIGDDLAQHPEVQRVMARYRESVLALASDLDSWELGYSDDDDGVWLTHGSSLVGKGSGGCGEEINLGFFASVQDALNKIGEHRCES